ncbi:MAG: recombinase family protein [Candidatus Ozemobacteraceae bacterium]
MKAIGYIRVSTEEQAESGLSLAHQRAKIEAYSMAMDLELVAVLEDAGKSAKNLNRPGMSKALEMIRTKEADALIILKLDRLTRSVKDLGLLVETFEKTGAALISVQDSINTTTAAGRLVLNVLGSVAQWEREAIGERTAAALSVKRERGEKTGGTAPYGYDLAENGRSLVPNTREQKALLVMRRLRSRGLSLRKVGAELTRRGIPTKTGGAWQAMTIKNLCEAKV